MSQHVPYVFPYVFPFCLLPVPFTLTSYPEDLGLSATFTKGGKTNMSQEVPYVFFICPLCVLYLSLLYLTSQPEDPGLSVTFTKEKKTNMSQQVPYVSFICPLSVLYLSLTCPFHIRFVYHIDEGAVAALTQYYRRTIKPESNFYICPLYVLICPIYVPYMCYEGGSGSSDAVLSPHHQARE